MSTVEDPAGHEYPVVAFLLGSTWLALHVFVAEHGHVLMAAALCGVTPAHGLLRRTATGRPSVAPAQ
ncbi:hypothetical protein ACI8AV_00985 [Geodermatophilus sp. SYSU D00804]